MDAVDKNIASRSSMKGLSCTKQGKPFKIHLRKDVTWRQREQIIPHLQKYEHLKTTEALQIRKQEHAIYTLTTRKNALLQRSVSTSFWSQRVLLIAVVRTAAWPGWRFIGNTHMLVATEDWTGKRSLRSAKPTLHTRTHHAVTANTVTIIGGNRSPSHRLDKNMRYYLANATQRRFLCERPWHCRLWRVALHIPLQESVVFAEMTQQCLTK